MPPSPAYRLVRSLPRPSRPPVLDPAQRAVVAHAGGPLLVLAGPGTGKTTTVVEAVVDRVARRSLDPERLLVLTFSRKAAAELRSRITARLGRTTREPLAMTFHSYAFALLRREALRTGTAAPRLLSGPEHDLEIRRLLRGEVEDGAKEWPARLRPALSTRGFASELRDLVLRAQERGLDGDGLADVGRAYGRDDWVAAGGFVRRYAARFSVDVVGPALDYAELVRRAAELLADPEVGAAERAAREWVFVDEYQDTDPAQEQLLTALAGGGRNLVVVGDPDQSIYAFRGADVANIREFPDRFPRVDGVPAPVLALTTCRRSGARLLAASRRVAAGLPAVRDTRAHRGLRPGDGSPAGGVQVLLAGSAAQEAAVVADVLRRAHLLDGLRWSEMGVLVRSAARSVPVLRRALASAGVPVAVAGDEIPLLGEPGVRPLLLLLRCAMRPDTLDEAAAVELLTGPMGAADPLRLRRLRRALRQLDALAGTPPSATGLLADALRDPRDLLTVRDWVRRPVDRVAGLLRTARETAAAGGTAEDVLWAVWSTSGLGPRWAATSAAGGSAADTADRALDAVLALFDAAARFVDRLPGAGPALFLDDVLGREIPGDTLAEQAPAGDAVRLLTAHRAKGLEWRLVVVAGVQEGRWPDLRLPDSLLGAEDLVDRLAGRAGGAAGRVAAALAEERRLFYVAVTRAAERLVVTAVGGTPDAEERPSRLLAELVPDYDAAPAAPRRPMSLPALVAELRAVVTDPAAEAALAASAAARLAELSAVGVPGADPASWYALTRLSTDQPVAGPDEPIDVSPSQVERVVTCPLRWFLERAVGAAAPTTTSQRVGNLVHALAALVLDPALATDVELVRRLDTIWGGVDVGGRWFSRRQRDVAVDQIRRLLGWHTGLARELVAVEERFEITSGRVTVRGRVDRLERDERGRGVVVDLKTGSSRPGHDELARLPQLGVYQHAVAGAGFAGHRLTEPGGAELVQLGKGAYKKDARVQPQPALGDDPDPEWVPKLLVGVAKDMSAARFRATVNDGCRNCPARVSCPLQPEGAQVTP